MSLALFNAIHAGVIEILYDEQNKPWFKQVHVGEFIGIANMSEATSKIDPENKKSRSEINVARTDGSYTPPKHAKPHDGFLSIDGVKKVVVGTRKPKAIDLAKSLGIDILSTKILSKEGETFSCISKVFKGEDMKEQYTVDGYRIDLYFPIHQLAIECDEYGHKDRDIGYEVTRQNHIETKLGCTFIRYNPDAKDFDIFDTINKIYNFIVNPYRRGRP